jgi:Amt family ammonium transporter
MAGAFLGRMNFLAWIVFVPLWVTFSYVISAFSIWGGGFLFQLGVIDYSGGYVIHVSSGTAGFVGAACIGPRHATDRASHRPSNLGFVMVGAGILWVGWNGFNGGDPVSETDVTSAALCTLHSALCSSLFARCSLLFALCSLLFALCSLLFA